DYFAVDVATVPIIVVRGADGNIRAFSNTCRHRGCVVARGEGNCRSFVCPYHAWSYALTGDLIAAPTDMEDSVGFDTKDFGLIPARLENWAGFLFVNLDRDAASLADYLRNMPELLARYDCGDFVQARRFEYEVRCN
ncbi:MAG: Rieske (2Fe-2S) protein, partial [Alphaproteobacteria bacterium]|nr:Rieske (2Fe-2S) protein [Alphaproteobacteria bacterium]